MKLSVLSVINSALFLWQISVSGELSKYNNNILSGSLEKFHQLLQEKCHQIFPTFLV
jgi:hypothetical protein